MPDTRHFRLRKPPAEPPYLQGPNGPVENPRVGEPRPFCGVALTFSVPTMAGKDVIDVPQTAYVGTRDFLKAQPDALPSQCFEIDLADDGQTITASGIAAHLLAGHDKFEPCDPVKKTTARSKGANDAPQGEKED